MEIRLATEEDIPRMQEIFRHARQFMADKGNPNQWTEGYPAAELIREDIAHGDCFVCLSEGRTVATFVLRSGDDPTYTVIYDGQWPDSRPYATIHRIASSGDRHGIFHSLRHPAYRHSPGQRAHAPCYRQRGFHLLWPDPLLERRRTTGLSPVKNTKGRIETLPTDLSNKNTKGRVNALPICFGCCRVKT